MNAPNRIAESPSQAGFTLVEVLVAFAVTALIVGAIYTAYTQGLRTSLATQRARDAALLAQSSLDAETGAPLRPKTIEDRAGPFERSVRVSPRPDLVPDGARLGVVPYEITVDVGWNDGRTPRTVSLSTLWIAPR